MLWYTPQLRVKRCIPIRKNTILYKTTRSHNPEVVGSSPASATKENTTQTGGVFFGYDSMLRSYHLLVVRSTSIARWVSEGSAAGGG